MNIFEQYPQLLPLLLLVILAIWELVWKAIAMWQAARSGNKIIYILLLIFNTAGIFPIAYLLINKNRHH